MLTAAGGLSDSNPDLSSVNSARRKRGHNVDFTEALEQFGDKMMAKLNTWKKEFGHEMMDMRQSLNDLKTEINNIGKENNTIKKSIQDLDNKQKTINEEVTSLKKSVQFHSDSHEEIKKRVDLFSKEVQSFSNLNAELIDIQIQNKKISAELNQREQKDRQQNIEIVGIPQSQDENLYTIMLQLAKHLSVDITREDIIHISRVSSLSKTHGRPKNIIVKLRTRLLKDTIISKVRKCRLTTLNLQILGKEKAVFVNEHLTLFNKNLLRKAKVLASTKEYQYTWVKNCKIYVRKAATQPAILIMEEEDLARII